MGGKQSRSKGRREEQQLVLHLASHYWKAERILQQYQKAGQPDVRAVKNGVTLTFEMKSSSRASYKSIYNMYDAYKDHEGALRFIWEGVAVGITTKFENLLPTDQHFSEAPPGCPLAQLAAFRRVVGTLKALKQDADFLVLRDNNKPRLFLKYWE